MNFFGNYKIIHDHQYEFRANHSLVHALLDVDIQTLHTVQNKQLMVLLLVDISSSSTFIFG